jgi:Tfp pilus assembly protein PilP
MKKHNLLLLSLFIFSSEIVFSQEVESVESQAETSLEAPAVPANDVLPMDSTDPALSSQAEAIDPGTAFLEPFLYDLREGRRNPFKPPQEIEAGTALGGFAGPTGPLERFGLDELKILAIMWSVAKPRVMVMDPNGDVYTAYKDERIGKKRGYIAVIRESEVVVVEPSNFNGETVYSTRILKLSE